MIGLDTNILVRYFVEDDPLQSAKAIEIIERQLSEDNLGYVSVVVMVELVWVLERSYHFGTSAIAGVIEGLLRSDVLYIENEQEVFTAMVSLKDGRGSFADVLLAALATKAGCSAVLTFDREASRLPGFRLA